jgi:hypothetical protein
MKTNKKAVLGMLVAMVMSLGVMMGINQKSNDSNLQQVGLGCAIGAHYTEGGLSAGLSYGAGVCGGTASGMAVVGAYGAAATTTNPVGWGYWVVTGVVAL